MMNQVQFPIEFMYGTLLLFKLYTYFPCSFYYVFLDRAILRAETGAGVHKHILATDSHPVKWVWGEGVNTIFHPPPWSQV